MCKFHTVFLSSDGRVLTCGHGNGGRLGHGNQDTILVNKALSIDLKECCLYVLVNGSQYPASFSRYNSQVKR